MGIVASVLVAVDFESASVNAVALGGAIVERCGARSLALLFAGRPGDQDDARERLRQFGRDHTAARFDALVDERPPADAILHAAEAADLVVMGTHGRSGPRRWWLGSVAEQVLRSTARPLLVARTAAQGVPGAVFSRVLVHAAAPLKGAATLSYARQVTACFDGEIVDGRHEPVEPALLRTGATLLVAAAPSPVSTGWMADYGEPLVRYATVPVLFVPDNYVPVR